MRLVAVGLISLFTLIFHSAVAQNSVPDWTGDWQSYWQTGSALLELTQSGERVTGTYQPDDGRVEAVVDGRLLRGTWRDPEGQGDFVFLLSDDGQTFAGRFDGGQYWNGYRETDEANTEAAFIGDGSPEDVLRSILTAGNDAIYHSRIGNLRFVDPMLRYESGGETATNRSRRRVALWNLLDISTIRLSDLPAPLADDPGSATFPIGPSGSAERFVLEFVREPAGKWRLVVPTLSELETGVDRLVTAAGYRSLPEMQSARQNSARGTLRRFVLGAADWQGPGRDTALATLDLRHVTDGLRTSEGVILADYLKQVIDRAGYLIWQEIPDDPVRQVPFVLLRHPAGNVSVAPIPIPVDVEDGAAPERQIQWLFPRETLDALPALYDAMEGLPLADGLEPPAHLSRFFSIRTAVLKSFPRLTAALGPLEFWQWIGTFGSIALAAVVVGLTAPLRRQLATLPVLAALVLPIGLALAAGLLLQANTALGLSLVGRGLTGSATAALLVIALATLAYRMTEIVRGLLMNRAEGTTSYADEIVISLAAGLFKLMIILGAIVAVADVVGLPYEGVLTGLGIGGVALAFASRDTVSNLLGGAILLTDRPFKRGDLVEAAGRMATIETVGLRSTRLRTVDDTLLTVPNSQLSDTAIANWGSRRRRKVQMTIGLTYDTPRAQLEAFTKGLLEVYKAQPRADANDVHVGVKELGAFSIDIEIWGYFRVLGYDAQVKAQEALILDIISLAEELGVSFAFPTQTLHVAPGEGTEGDRGSPPISQTGQRAALEPRA